ncbi:MAG: type II toxin-antitoxin system Phd/YefM family antitoxin [Verrucomicrobiota bacterium]
MIAVEEALSKLQSLSPDRSQHVLALIEDLAELQALENKQDVEDALAALAESGQDIPLEQVAKELGV